MADFIKMFENSMLLQLQTIRSNHANQMKEFKAEQNVIIDNRFKLNSEKF